MASSSQNYAANRTPTVVLMVVPTVVLTMVPRARLALAML
jgi:hypothetical protein